MESIGNIIGQGLVLSFMLFIGYGAFLIVRDKERDWKERYGNRWILSHSEKEELDRLYAERKAQQKGD